MAKNNFQDELMLGMQQELQPYEKKQGMGNLVKAAEYLHAAIEILEEDGLTANADQILRILGKLATSEDVNDVASSKKDVDFYNKIMRWLEDPATPVDPENPQPNEELSFTSLKDVPKEKPVEEELQFTSLFDEPEPTISNEDMVFKSIANELGLIDSDPEEVSDSESLFDDKFTRSDNSTGDWFDDQMPKSSPGTWDEDLLEADIPEDSLEITENDLDKTFEDSD